MIGDCTKEIAEKAAACLSGDIQANRAGFNHEAKQVEVDGPQLEIEDGTGAGTSL